jgi:subtilisin family serine protease
VVWYDDSQQRKARSEAAIIVGAFAEKNIEIAGVLTDDGWISYMYAEGQFLVREQYLDSVERLLGRRGRLFVRKRVIRDILLVELQAPSSDSDSADAAREGGDQPVAGERPSVYALLDEIDVALGPGIATPDHVVTAANGSPTGCPATEPQEVYDPTPFPPLCPGSGGDRVRIWVADTGIVANTVTTCGWLANVTGDPDPSVGGSILPYGGHGTFVAGVIRAMAPQADIVVKCVFDIAGSALESDFVPKLYGGFGFGADIIHITVVSQTRHNLPLIAFEAWLQDMHSHKGVVCIVPAGNNSSRHPCWPAAFPGLISVGALATDWCHRAYFSNYGGWVDVYAPGESLVNAFATGTFTCKVAPFAGQVRTFSGMAQWSGTSFSTPIVTGLIAARMTRCGESAQEAAEALLARARAQAIPGVGPALFPGCDGDEERGGRCDGGCGCGCHCGCGGGSGCGGRCGGGGCGCRGGCGCGGGGGGGRGHRGRGPVPR